MRFSCLGKGLSTALAMLLAASIAFGQSQITTGTIQGTVRDESGAVIPGATVVLKHAATGTSRELTTDENGRYVAPLLPVGEYELSFSVPGFATLIQKGIVLSLGQTVVSDAAMKVAEVQSVVTVRGDTPLVETARTESSALVDSRSVANLPLNGRRFLDLAFLTPGVSQELERGQLSFAGQRGINSSVNIDGADFNNPFFGGQRGGERTNDSYVVSQEAIQEFQVVRSGFAPEFGRATGGIVNVITKSGSNDFHGSAFYFLRHSEFSPLSRLGDAAATRHQYGATVGGPIVKDRTFFFAAYDGQRQREPLIVRFGTTSGLPQNLLEKQGVFESTNDVHTMLAKVDHQLTSGTRLSTRYNLSRNDALNGTFTGTTTGVFENNGVEKDRTHTIVSNLNTVFSPVILNEFRVQVSYEDRPRQNNGEGMDFQNKVGPQVQVSGCCFFGGVSFLPIVQDDSRFQIADNFSYVRGSHNLKLGFDFNRAHVDQIFRGNWRGVYIFNTVQGFVDALNRKPGAAADQFRVFFGRGTFNVSAYDVAGFFQDTWKVHPRVTLTGGLRWESAIHPQPIQPNPLLPQTSQIPSDKKEWQPRLGLSVDLTGDGKTVLRASSGIFYARTPMLLLNQAFNSNGNPNVGVTFTLNRTQILSAQRQRQEFVFPFVPDTSSAANAKFFTDLGIAGLRPDASFFPADYRNPQSYNASVGIERLLSNNLAVTLEWVHSNTWHLERIRDVNLFPPVVGLDNSTPPVQRRLFNVSVRPNANFNILRQQESSSRSNYEAFTLSLNKRYSRGYQFLTSYTLSYNRDDDSNERNFAGIAYEDAYDLKREFRWSRNDIRHRWVGNGTVDLPFGILASGILNYRSGLAFSAFTGTDSNRDSQFTDKPIIAGKPLLRNMFRQPNFFNLDTRVSKSFRVHEEHKVEVIADMFNVLNHTNYFYRVSTNESSTGAAGSRWGRGQTPEAAFRTIRLADGSFNRAGARVSSPFQLQIALRYTF